MESATSTSEQPTDKLRVGDRVVADAINGMIKQVYEQGGNYYYMVGFPIGSPYPDDWAIFRHKEVVKR